MIKSNLSEALRLLRTYHDISQSALASQLEISRSYLSEIESGKKQPSLDLIKKYSDHFSIPVSTILLFSETVEAGDFAEKVRKISTSTVITLLSWAESKKRRLDVIEEQA